MKVALPHGFYYIVDGGSGDEGGGVCMCVGQRGRRGGGSPGTVREPGMRLGPEELDKFEHANDLEESENLERTQHTDFADAGR